MARGSPREFRSGSGGGGRYPYMVCFSDGGAAGVRRTFLAGVVSVGNLSRVIVIGLPLPAPARRPLPLSLAYPPSLPAASLIIGNSPRDVESVGINYLVLIPARMRSHSRLPPSTPVCSPSVTPPPRIPENKRYVLPLSCFLFYFCALIANRLLKKPILATGRISRSTAINAPDSLVVGLDR